MLIQATKTLRLKDIEQLAEWLKPTIFGKIQYEIFPTPDGIIFLKVINDERVQELEKN